MGSITNHSPHAYFGGMHGKVAYCGTRGRAEGAEGYGVRPAQSVLGAPFSHPCRLCGAMAAFHSINLV